MDTYIRCVIYVIAVLLGLCIGSFINVVIYRLPRKMSLAYPASHCTSCGYSLRWYDNVPLFSYIFLGGKCRRCKARISPRYFVVELLNAFFYAASVTIFGHTPKGVAVAAVLAIATSLLICVFCIDLEHMIIYNRFSLGLAFCGVALMFLDEHLIWYERLVGAAVGGLSFSAIYYLALLILKKEGLGFGDVKLAAATGLFLGWQKFILAILIASVCGSVVMLSLKAIRKEKESREYPFGPFISTGAVFAIFCGDAVINWYTKLIFL